MNYNRPSDDDLEITIPRPDRMFSEAGSRPLWREPSEKSITAVPVGFSVPAARDWYFFSIELQTALKAGISFVQALELVGNNIRNGSIRRSMNHILQKMREKGSARRAISDAEHVPPLIRNLLIVGLSGGNTPAVLEHIVRHYQWVLEMRGRILKTITYPLSLALLGPLVMVFRDVTIASMTGKMPVDQALPHFAVIYFTPVFLGAALAIVMAWLVSTNLLRPAYDRVVLTTPVLGKMILSYSAAMFYRVLALLVESGMPATDGWAMAARSVANGHVGQRLMTGIHYLQDGETMEEALRQTKLLDRNARSFLAAGETAGDIPKLLKKYADYQEMELKSWVRGLIGLIGFPCLILLALGFFWSPLWLSLLMFLLVFARRMV